MKRATREWVRKAEADYRLAEAIAHGSEPFHDQLCFHAQQSAEKYLKALLEELGQPVPKLHDLDQLALRLLPFHPTLSSLQRGFSKLTDFAVDTRYPGCSATKRQAVSALRWAGRIRHDCRTLLGLRPPRPRSSKLSS
ncbi:MAG: HEPN domain-containing protein [Planctomycetaceae bacterium]|nr:HEPN domain-containing protein [Planctomycetaceae bacterium]